MDVIESSADSCSADISDLSPLSSTVTWIPLSFPWFQSSSDLYENLYKFIFRKDIKISAWDITLRPCWVF